MAIGPNAQGSWPNKKLFDLGIRERTKSPGYESDAEVTDLITCANEHDAMVLRKLLYLVVLFQVIGALVLYMIGFKDWLTSVPCSLRVMLFHVQKSKVNAYIILTTSTTFVIPNQAISISFRGNASICYSSNPSPVPSPDRTC